MGRGATVSCYTNTDQPTSIPPGAWTPRGIPLSYPLMLLTRRELPILFFNLVYIPVFAVIAWGRSDEFLLYVAVIVTLGGIILVHQRSVQFPCTILWGLSIWGLLHMAGGLVPVGDTVLYGVVLVPIVPSYGIFRFDQLVQFSDSASPPWCATTSCNRISAPTRRKAQGTGC